MYGSYAHVFDKIWESIAEKKATASNPRDPPKTLHECSWTVGTLCHDLEEGLRRRKSVINGDNENSVYVGKPYIPYGKISPTNTQADSNEAQSILNSLFKEKYRGVFTNTRIDKNMKKIIQDFTTEIKTKTVFSKKSFQFGTYDLQLKKGTEIEEVYKEYYKMGVTTTEEFYRRLVRDFFTTAFMFQFIKGFDPNSLSICASIHCFTICVDYVDSSDGYKIGGRKPYETAIADGLTLCSGHAYAESANNVILATAFMKYKDDTLDQYMLENFTHSKPEYKDKIPSPFEYLEVRWWDGALPSILTMPFVFSNQSGIATDDHRVPFGARQCPAIRAGLDTCFRYDDIIDVMHDIQFKEPFNEIHVAARYGGLSAVINYANGVAATVENVADCNCSAGDDIHDWTLDQAIGTSCFYSLVPRYRAVTQLAEMSYITSAKYELLRSESNHAAFIIRAFAKIDNTKNPGALHDDNWVPIFNMTNIQQNREGEDCQSCKEICKWIIGRCIYRSNRAYFETPVLEFIKSVVHANSSQDMGRFFRDLIRLLGIPQFPEDIVELCADAVDTIWETLRMAGSQSCSLQDLAAKVVKNHIRIDTVIQQTHQVKDTAHYFICF